MCEDAEKVLMQGGRCDGDDGGRLVGQSLGGGGSGDRGDDDGGAAEVLSLLERGDKVVRGIESHTQDVIAALLLGTSGE